MPILGVTGLRTNLFYLCPFGAKLIHTRFSSLTWIFMRIAIKSFDDAILVHLGICLYNDISQNHCGEYKVCY
jgi:hypothetical protein